MQVTVDNYRLRNEEVGLTKDLFHWMPIQAPPMESGSSVDYLNVHPVCYGESSSFLSDSSIYESTLATACSYYIISQKEEPISDIYETFFPIKSYLETNVATITVDLGYLIYMNAFHQSPIFQKLSSFFNEYRYRNWDGYKAEALKKEAYIEAQSVLKMIPDSIPEPEFVPEPSGDIALEWYSDRDHIFVLGLSGEGEISYAGKCGRENRVYGTEQIEEKLPDALIEYINRIYE